MLYTIPDYYKKFRCIADQCEDTCCAGWQIVIDDRSLRRYKNEKGAFGKRLYRQINWRKGVFRQSKGKVCAFLNQNNLCDLYSELGEKALCKTCKNYPRHVEEFENVREITLSVSCPEVARILLTKNEPVTFQNYERETMDEELEGFDLFLYSALLDARDTLISILQNRSLDLSVRMALILGLAHDLEKCVREERLFEYQEILNRYLTKQAEQYAKKTIDGWNGKYQFSKEMFQKLYLLERLRDDWEWTLQEVLGIRYLAGEKCYHKADLEFQNWNHEEKDAWEIQKEQLLVYFVSTYFCGAIYDGRIRSKIQSACVHVQLLEEFLITRWLKNEKKLDLEDKVELVYRYSREVEHSDENLEKVEKLFCFPMTRKKKEEKKL